MNIFFRYLILIIEVIYVLILVFFRKITNSKRNSSWSYGFEVLLEILRMKMNSKLNWKEISEKEKLVFIKRLRSAAVRHIPKDPKDVMIQNVSVSTEITGYWVHVPEAKNSEKVIYYLHGGGYVAMCFKAYKPMLFLLARKSKCKIFALDYRLAPEHKFPTSQEDGVLGYKYLLNEAKISSKNITFIGDSAGGGLCCSVLLKLKNENLQIPKNCVLISPWVDLTQSEESWKRKNEMDYLPYIPELTEMVVNDPKELKNPLYSPLFADFSELKGFKILIHAGKEEVLLDEILKISEKMKKEGLLVEACIYNHMPHVFHVFIDLCKESIEAIDHIAQFINKD